MTEYLSFPIEGANQKVEFIETIFVREGVECDVYTFPEYPDADLGIIRIQKGAKTPRQRVVQGEKTIEGYLSGKGKLSIEKSDKSKIIHETPMGTEIPVQLDEIMQWEADTDLVVYEICYPPYKDGRYINLED